jgi:uncharacterized protein DUF1552
VNDRNRSWGRARTGEISRRAVLRGLGVTMALPMLEAMAATGSIARAAGSMASSTATQAAPLRMAFIFAPNGVNFPAWKPTGTGRDYKLSQTLSPLEPVRKHLNIMRGLTLQKARANGDGPGDHARSSATFLTGQQARKTSGNDINLGISVDQFAARQIGTETRMPSLELGCENGKRAGSCDSGYACAYSSNVSWADEDSPMPKMVNPAAVFETLFGDARRTEEQRQRLKKRASILDFVRDESKRMERHLGTADREKLAEFQESVREIERRVQAAATETGDAPDPGRPAPTGIPRKVSEHIDLMFDMLLLAFKTDTTRISTFMIGTGGSNRSIPEIGVREGHHQLSHHKGVEEMVEKIRRIDKFYVERFARFVQSLADTREGDASLIDNCLIMYGSGICDGNRHNHEDLPVVLAGNGGGTVETGRLVEYPRETPLCNLYVSMLERMGCDVGSFGDSSGPLPKLLG